MSLGSFTLRKSSLDDIATIIPTLPDNALVVIDGSAGDIQVANVISMQMEEGIKGVLTLQRQQLLVLKSFSRSAKNLYFYPRDSLVNGCLKFLF